MYHLWCFSIYFGNTVITKVHVVFVFTTFSSCKMGCCSASDTFSLEQSSSGRGGSFFTSDAVDGILMHCCDYTYPVDYLIWKTENEALFILLIWAILFLRSSPITIVTMSIHSKSVVSFCQVVWASNFFSETGLDQLCLFLKGLKHLQVGLLIRYFVPVED